MGYSSAFTAPPGHMCLHLCCRRFLGRKEEGKEEFLLGEDLLTSRGAIKVTLLTVIRIRTLRYRSNTGTKVLRILIRFGEKPYSHTFRNEKPDTYFHQSERPGAESHVAGSSLFGQSEMSDSDSYQS